MTPELSLMIAIGAPILGALLIAVFGKRWGHRVGTVAWVLPMASFLALLALWGAAGPTPHRVIEWPWIPTLGIPLSFLVDGLSIFFGLVVTGVGVLVFFYARQYLDESYSQHNRFYAFLALFMAAMLGTVFANNLLLLFVFWELTGLASFLLIGFTHVDEVSRRGARMALLVTGGTGLLLMLGVVLLGQGAGTYALDELLVEPGRFAGKDWYNAAFLFMALGAFGKSAQFPFQFWLPNAMAAPTPVSVYLHSATMVKLGVFLLARVLPIFQAADWWLPLLAVIGFGTMLLGAVLALLSHDLKAILAYSTVSQLGYLVGGYGVAPGSGIDYDYLHILNHVLYKGGLFMIAGIVDHATGTRDLRRLGGLGRRLPLLGLVTLLATATMAGVIGTTGFISKEVMLAEILEVMKEHGALGGYAAAAVVVTSVIKVAFSCRIYTELFHGREPEGLGKHFHRPSFAFQLPPLLLASAALLFGVVPAALEGPLDLLSVSGLHSQSATHLAIWHGWTVEFGVSVAILLLGFGVFAAGRVTRWRWATVPWFLRFDEGFERGVDGLGRWSKVITKAVGSDNPGVFLRVALAFSAFWVGGFLVLSGELTDIWALVAAGLTDHRWSGLRVLTALLIAVAALGTAFARRWTTQLITLAVCGFLICFYFVLYRAPDLALTQILIETVTLILLLYLLGRFPRKAQLGEFEDQRSIRRNLVPGLVAVGVGVLVTGLGLLVTAQPHPEPMGCYFLAQTAELAEGTNAVNTILVDFRGFDTLGEITVLVIAMTGVLGLVMRKRRTAEEFRQGPLGPPGLGIGLDGAARGVRGDAGPRGRDLRSPRAAPRSVIFVAVGKGAFILLNVFALYLLLRGHNLPGGGFIAGLVTAISFVMLSLALGWEKLDRVLRLDPVALAVGGLGLALVSGAMPMFWGRPFLEQFMTHVQVPFLGEVHVGTTLLFDAGVFLVVVGVTCKLLFVLRMSDGRGGLSAAEQVRYASPVEEPIEPEERGGEEVRHAG
jgi:NADH:ubiquinone oxidoreductase subunit 5 (subunit L)/multisubunit Na+/H+ antiporter MnhA subunit/multisubunit Na+/H+ antiporter MnhB subunit